MVVALDFCHGNNYKTTLVMLPESRGVSRPTWKFLPVRIFKHREIGIDNIIKLITIASRGYRTANHISNKKEDVDMTEQLSVDTSAEGETTTVVWVETTPTKKKKNGRRPPAPEPEPEPEPLPVPRQPILGISKKKAYKAAQIIQTVAVARRIMILQLCDGVTSVKEICDIVDQQQAAVSHHLSLLRLVGAIEPVKRNRVTIYSCTPMGYKLLELVEKMLALGMESEDD
jgi:DNA-binding transcriptional ArsR family regulator